MSGVKLVDQIDTLHPRIGVSVGVTLRIGEYLYVKPGVSMEVDVPMNLSVDEAIDELTDYLLDKLIDVEDKLSDYVHPE